MFIKAIPDPDPGADMRLHSLSTLLRCESSGVQQNGVHTASGLSTGRKAFSQLLFIGHVFKSIQIFSAEQILRQRVDAYSITGMI